GASRVVLRQFGDLVEQRAALRVIEPLGRQRLRFRGEPGPGVGAECFLEEAGRQPAVEGCHRIAILPSSVFWSGEAGEAGEAGLPGAASAATLTCRAVAVTTEPSGTSVQPGSSSPGSEARTTACPDARYHRVSP